MESVSFSDVKELLTAGMSYQEISEKLKQLYPGIQQGLSSRSVRRFVNVNNLRESANHDAQEAVRESIEEVSVLEVGQCKSSCMARLQANDRPIQ